VHAPAVAFERAHLVVDAAALVERQVGVLGTLDVDVRLQRLDRRQRRRLVDDRDVVDELERGDLTRAVVLGERDRALLRDVAIGRNRHHEDVAERSCLIEMREVPDVHEIEGAMTLDDALVAQPLADPREIVDGHDLVARRDAVDGSNHVNCAWPFTVNPAFIASPWNILTVSSENASRFFPTESSLFRMSVVTVMMWQPI
jgi:hypothetical protein